MSTLESLLERYEAYKQMKLALNMQRGQPSDADFDLSNAMLTIVDETTLVTPSGVAIRNYPGGTAGLKEARQLFGGMLGVAPEETIVGNNASLELMANTLMWALLRGVLGSPAPWVSGPRKAIVTVPGYDRHFRILEELGFEMLAVPMQGDGPDLDAIEALVAGDPAIKVMMFVPTYSNPTGETISDEKVRRLAAMPTAAPDFTILADEAYIVHHLNDNHERALNLLTACKEAGNPNRVYLFGSTSKITFAGGGIGFIGTSVANVKYITNLMGAQSIGPNKVEQYRHVRFLGSYPGGIPGLMAEHAKILAPKFAAVQEALEQELGGTGLASWTNPNGGYFVSLDTTLPVASRVVELAQEVGVSLTPAGATYPYEKDPNDRNIRLSPSRPPVEEVRQAMEVVGLCVKIASAEYNTAA